MKHPHALESLEGCIIRWLQNPAVDAFDQGAGLGGLACAAALGKARGYVVVDDPKNHEHYQHHYNMWVTFLFRGLLYCSLCVDNLSCEAIFR